MRKFNIQLTTGVLGWNVVVADNSESDTDPEKIQHIRFEQQPSIEAALGEAGAAIKDRLRQQ